jgi:sugar phosphate permease
MRFVTCVLSNAALTRAAPTRRRDARRDSAVVVGNRARPAVAPRARQTPHRDGARTATIRWAISDNVSADMDGVESTEVSTVDPDDAGGAVAEAVLYTFPPEDEECVWEENGEECKPGTVVEEEFPRAEVEALQRKTLAGMFISYSSAYFVRKPFSVVKAPVKAALGLSTSTMGLIDSAFLATYAIGQFVMPAFGEKLGAKNLIIVGGFISAACCLAFGFISLPYVLMTLWALNGLAQAASYPLHVKLLNPWFASKERGTAMGVWATSQQVGATLATIFAAFLLGKAGWRAAIGLPALFAVCTSVMLMFMNLDPPWLQTTTYKQEALQNTKKRADTEPASKQVSFMEILAIPRLKMLMVSYFFVKIVRYCLLFWLPFYLSEEYKMPVAIAGYLSCVYDLGGVLGGLACGVIGDKYFEGRRPMLGAISCAMLTFAIGGYQLACTMGMLTNALVMGLIGFLVAGPDAMLGSTAVADCCEQAGYGQEVLGTAAGVVNGMGSIGAVLQGALTAVIAEKYGWGALFVTLAVLSALSVVSLLAATNSKFVDPENESDTAQVAYA